MIDTSHLPFRSEREQITTQNQLIQQLNKLNGSLKLQLDECHKYIQTLEMDLRDHESKQSLSIKSLERWNGEDLVLVNQELLCRVKKLEGKLSDKRGRIQRLEMEREGLESHFCGLERQKQQMLQSMNNLQYLLDNRSSADKQALTKLQATLAQQRQTIQLYYKQLNGKSSVIEKMYVKLEDMERQRGVIINENQGLRQVNFNLAQKLHESEKKGQEREIRMEAEVKALEKKYNAELGELKRVNRILKEEVGQSKNAIINGLSMKFSKIEAGGKGVGGEESLPKEEAESAGVQYSLREQIGQDKEMIERLKSNLMAMKLENSSLIVRNNTLADDLVKIERSRNQLLAKADDYNIRTIKNMHNDQPRYFQSLRKSTAKGASFQTSLSKRVSKTPQPQDQEVPVHDRGSLKQGLKPNPDLTETRKGNKISKISSMLLTYQ